MFTVTSGSLIAAMSVNNFDGGGLGYDLLRYNDGGATPSAVPEPATLVLVGLGLASGVRGRRRTA